MNPNLFSLLAIESNKADLSTKELTDCAIEAAVDAADPAWRDTAIRVVRGLCMSQATLSADDIWNALKAYNEATHEPRALGGILRHCAKLGYCKVSDQYIKSRLPQRHSRPIPLWYSLLYL
jgi:hypothetical protein